MVFELLIFILNTHTAGQTGTIFTLVRPILILLSLQEELFYNVCPPGLGVYRTPWILPTNRCTALFWGSIRLPKRFLNTTITEFSQKLVHLSTNTFNKCFAVCPFLLQWITKSSLIGDGWENLLTPNNIRKGNPSISLDDFPTITENSN